MTFSIAGRCARTGMFGVSVTTSSLAVGSRCPYVKAGVGAVLTQNRTDPRLGPLALDLLSRGFDARQAMDAVVAAAGDPRRWRQLAIVDRDGRTAAFTGADVRGERGEVHGKGCVAIANIVRSADVPAAMVRAFEAEPDQPLASRLIVALQAGEETGGEFVPLVSAAVLVADKQPFPYVDLRVDGAEDPIGVLARLWHDYAPSADMYVARAVDPESIVVPPPPPR